MSKMQALPNIDYARGFADGRRAAVEAAAKAERSAFEAGYIEAFHASAIEWLTVLTDKERHTTEDAARIYAELVYLSDSINRGYVTLADLDAELKKIDIEVAYK
jgi:hypothetical protein